MKISGFTMVKNATSLYYPIKSSIESILPIVDEYVIALGNCDDEDKTKDEILSIKSSKIRIIETNWDIEKYPRGMENAHQTDIAKEACNGDWLFYLQADEVVHEKYINEIYNKCEEYLNDERIEGILFGYKHFWGDYNHYQLCHGWYPKEIRIIRNNKEIHSWESAQSFRRIPNFDYINYRQQEDTYKLKVKEIKAKIYHYGWVRPPNYMQNKRISLDTIHKGEKGVQEIYKLESEEFDYGPLKLAKIFKGTHPKVMEEWISKFDWADKLYEYGPIPKNRPKYKHERFKYRFLTLIEQHLMGGRTLMGFDNYELI